MVRCKGELSQVIKYGICIIQGDSLSPLIFELIMNGMIKRVKRRKDTKWEKKKDK